MKIKVLGPGCSKCQQLEKTVKEVVTQLGIQAEIEDVKEMREIMAYPIMSTPGLVVNEKLVCFGRVPSKADVTGFITAAVKEQT